MDEINIIKNCQLGNLESFNGLFLLYGNKAIRTAYLLTNRNDLAEDIVQYGMGG